MMVIDYDDEQSSVMRVIHSIFFTTKSLLNDYDCKERYLYSKL